MSSFAYKAHLPCLNTQCKSYGSPHYGCLCYGKASGGEVGHFCSESRPHHPHCEYYEAGGDVINPDEVVMDAAPEEQPEIPNEEVQQDDEINPDEVKLDNPYDTTEQQIKAGVEGAIQGAVGPLAAPIEKRLGVKPQDIAAREATFPWTHGLAETATLGAGVAAGVGIGGAANAATRLLPESIPLLKIAGAAALKAGIEMGLFQASDEASKALLGQQGADHEASVAGALTSIGGAALLGSATGGLFNVMAPTISKLNPIKAGKWGLDFATGIGIASEFSKADSMGIPGNLGDLKIDLSKFGDNKTVQNGINFYTNYLSKIGAMAARAPLDITSGVAAGYLGEAAAKHLGLQPGITGPVIGPLVAAATDKLFGDASERILGRPISNGIKKYTTPAFIRALSAGYSGLGALQSAINYAQKVGVGTKHIKNAIEGCFVPGAQQTYDAAISDSQRQRLLDIIEEGGVDNQIQNQSQAEQQQAPQSYADGGMVTPKDPEIESSNEDFGSIFPEQNIMLNTAKGRISNYLNSIRPLPNSAKLPFDKEMPQIEKERSYNKAIDIALKPLGILNHVRNSTLEPEHMQHANAMYPELMNHLRKKMTERITKAQVDEEMPSYRKRQAMSLFMGTPLDGTMTQPAMMAVQNLYMQQAMAKQQAMAQAPAPKKKKSNSSLSAVSDSSLTADQAREKRQQKV